MQSIAIDDIQALMAVPVRQSRLATQPRKREPEPVTWQELERQDWHLWMAAVLFIGVLGASVLTFMFPAAFWFGDGFGIRSPHRAFFGFCLMLGLMSAYLLQRQRVIRGLKRQIFAAQEQARESEKRALVESFLSLPGISPFRDGLAMEYRRAASTESSLAMVLFTVSTSDEESMGRVASLLRTMLWRGETIARLSGSSIGLILPAMHSADANAFAAQVEQRTMTDLRGINVTASTACYPDQATSLRDLEAPLRGVTS